MAPELISTDPKYSQQSDIFALAITFWEIASSKIPFEEADNSVVPVLIARGDREKIPADCPPEFGRIITRCWAQKASDRLALDNVITELKQMHGVSSAPAAASLPAYRNNVAPASSGAYTQPQQRPQYQVNNVNSLTSTTPNPFTQLNRK
jgi:hypothetical protein